MGSTSSDQRRTFWPPPLDRLGWAGGVDTTPAAAPRLVAGVSPIGDTTAPGLRP